jgi:hypothetical protein
MLTVFLIKRRAQSPTDDRLAARQTVQSCVCDFVKQALLEGRRCGRDPPQGTARSHIAGTTKATPR